MRVAFRIWLNSWIRIELRSSIGVPESSKRQCAAVRICRCVISVPLQIRPAIRMAATAGNERAEVSVPAMIGAGLSA